MAVSTDRIEKDIVIRAPRARVWRALTDAREFGSWFGAELKGAVFRARREGQREDHFSRLRARDASTWRSSAWSRSACCPGAGTRTRWTRRRTTRASPPRWWCSSSSDVPEGTLLKVVESGFDALPIARRAEAWRMNDEGWAIEMKNIERHVTRAQ